MTINNFTRTLIFLLFIAVFLYSGLFLLEIFSYRFTFDRFIIILVLCASHIHVFFVLYNQKSNKMLLIIVISYTVLLLIGLVLDYVWLSHFIDDHRENFHRLIRASSFGQKPSDSTLRATYRLIEKTRCCGIDDYRKMEGFERIYFQRMFRNVNCRNQFGGYSMSRRR